MNKNYANNMWLRRNADVITSQRLYDNRHIVDWKFATRYFGTDIDESWLDPNEPDTILINFLLSSNPKADLSIS